jgi:hypothetical protein
MDLVLRSIGKAIGEHGIKWKGKIFLDLDYAEYVESRIAKVCVFVVEAKFRRIGK